MPTKNPRYRRTKTHSMPDPALMKAYKGLPDEVRPYCAYLLCAANDILKVLSMENEPVSLLRQFDPELAKEAGLIRRVKSVAGRLANDAGRFRRYRMSWDDMKRVAVSLLDGPLLMSESGKPLDSLPDVIIKLSDFIDAMTLAMDQKLNVRSAERLLRLLNLIPAVTDNRSQLMSRWRDLEDFCELEAKLRTEALAGSGLVEIPDDPVESDVILACVKDLTRDEQIFCSYLQNSLVGAIMMKTGDRITLLEEKLQELEVDDDIIDLILEQVSACASADGHMPPLDKLGKPIRAGFNVSELAGKALRSLYDKFDDAVMNDFADEEEGENEGCLPLRDAFATLYTALVYLYETNDGDLDVKVMRDTELPEFVRYAVKCTKVLLGVLEAPILTVKPQKDFDATGVLAHLKKTLSSGEYAMTACGFEAVSRIFKVVFSKRQLTRDVESHLLLRDRAYFKRMLDNVWPIHQLGDEWRIFGGEPDIEAIQKMLPKRSVAPDQLSAHLMPYAERVANALMKLPVERRNVVIAVTCHNDLIRTLGRMDGREKLDTLEEAAGAEGPVMLYNFSSTFISLVSYCLHKHPLMAEAVAE